MEFKNQDSVLTFSTESAVTSRPLAKYHPDLWETRFLSQSESNMAWNEHSLVIEALKEELKKELNEIAKSPLQQLQLIDAIQRLGVEYHFEMEIDQHLQNIFETYDHYCKNNNDLYSTSLCFRLLRQHGHNVSCGKFLGAFPIRRVCAHNFHGNAFVNETEIFEKFKDVKSEFKTSITSDVIGMLEFYEAAHLSVRGEDIMDDALSFTRTHLQSILPDLVGPISEHVFNALENYSNRRGLTRLEAQHYISIYQKEASHHPSLLRLAKLDFNMLQSLHKKELSEVYRWWKGLDVTTKLPYIRDRMVETYFWIVGVYFEPQYSLARKILSKVQAIASIFDDTYDAYGTFEELKIFTEAIERSTSGLHESNLQGTLELFEEIEDELTMQGRSYRVTYGKEAVKILVRAYFDEAKWRHERYMPTMEEYMHLATRSCGYTTLIIISFLGVGDVATREAFDWVLNQPDIVKASLIICRLTDDIVGHEFEQKRDHIPSAVECYMKQYKVSKQEAIDEFNIRIEAAWKEMNQGFLKPTKIQASLLYRILNFARVIEVMYKKGDWYTHVGPEMQSFIKELFVDPIT